MVPYALRYGYGTVRNGSQVWPRGPVGVVLCRAWQARGKGRQGLYSFIHVYNEYTRARFEPRSHRATDRKVHRKMPYSVSCANDCAMRA